MTSTRCGLLSRKGEQSTRQIGPAECRLECLVRQLIGFCVAFSEIAQQVDIADDNAEQVVEIVRHTTSQIADCFHFLRLMQLRFEFGAFRLLLFLIGEVAQYSSEVAMTAGPPFGNRQMRRKDDPILATDFEFPHSPKIARGIAFMLLPQAWRQQHPHILGGDLGERIAGHSFGRLVEFSDDAMLVGDNNGIDCGLEDGPISTLAFSQLPFGGRTFAAFVAEISEKEHGEPDPQHGGDPAQAGEEFGQKLGHRARSDFPVR